MKSEDLDKSENCRKLAEVSLPEEGQSSLLSHESASVPLQAIEDLRMRLQKVTPYGVLRTSTTLPGAYS